MKVIDCFPFFNELDLLEIRLNELKSVVDIFVITESPQTFTGMKKPLFLKDNQDRFKEFNIIYAPYNDDTKCRPMERERRQKQYNLDYAFDNVFESGDIIMYGDCDEIPKASVISELLDQAWESVGLITDLFYYYLNCKQVGKPKNRLASIRLVKPTERIIYDVSRKNTNEKLVDDAGYHFSYLTDIPYKLKSWGHAGRFNCWPYNDLAYINKCKRLGLDFLNRQGNRKVVFQFVSDIGYLPKYVQDNLDKYSKYIYKYE